MDVDILGMNTDNQTIPGHPTGVVKYILKAAPAEHIDDESLNTYEKRFTLFCQQLSNYLSIASRGGKVRIKSLEYEIEYPNESSTS